MGKFDQVPSRDLQHHIVQTGLETGCGGTCHRVLELWESDTQTQLGRYVGQRVTGGLRGKGGASGEASVDLNDVILRVAVGYWSWGGGGGRMGEIVMVTGALTLFTCVVYTYVCDVYMCVHVCVCMYVCACMCVYVCMRVYVSVHMITVGHRTFSDQSC